MPSIDSPDQQLTPHFALSEFVVSRQAITHGINNTPSAALIETMRTVLAPGLERVRGILGTNPIVILSGYRCPRLNGVVGGSINSAHMAGRAADILVPGYGTPRQVCEALIPHLAELRVRQLIWEGEWTHIEFNAPGPSVVPQVLTARWSNGRPRYSQGLA